MVLRQVVVKKKPRLFCDGCGKWLRYQKEPNLHPQFELLYKPVGSDTEILFRFKDLCKTCNKWIEKIAVRAARNYTSSRQRANVKG